MTRRLIGLITTATLGLALALPAAAQERAGETKRSQQSAYQQANILPELLNVGDEIYQQASVYTQDHGSLELAFDDGSSLTLGPNTDLVIDEFVYQPSNGQGEAALSITRGVLRMVSGRVPSERVRISTPVATVGIRGTRFTLDSNQPGTLKVWADEGIVTVAPRQSSVVFALEAPAFAVCTVNVCQEGPAPVQPTTFPTSPPNVGPFRGRDLHGDPGSSEQESEDTSSSG